MATIIPDVHRAIADAIHWAALFLNIMLLYLIAKRSKFTTKIYKHVIGVSCSSDLLLAFSAILCRPVAERKFLCSA